MKTFRVQKWVGHIVFIMFFLLFCAFDVNARAAVLTTTGDTPGPINLNSYNGSSYTGLVNYYKILNSYDNATPTYAVSGTNVTDGITNYGIISESTIFSSYQISGQISNYAINVLSSSGDLTFTNSGTINNSVNLSGFSSTGGIANYGADLEPSGGSAIFTNLGSINNSVNLSGGSRTVGITNYGADLYPSGSVTFTNSDSINNSVNLSDGSSSADVIYNEAAYLTPSSGSVTFTNSDSINNSVNLSGGSSSYGITNYGADLEPGVSAFFTNSGSINNSVNLSDGSSSTYGIDNEAAYLTPSSGSAFFTNSGSINNSVNLSGGSSTYGIYNYGADLEPPGSATFTNSGTINNYVNLTNNSGTGKIYNEAAYLSPYGSAFFTNSGTINVSTTLDTSSQTASGSNLKSAAADLYFSAPSGSITNTGAMSLSGYFTNPTNNPSYISSAILLYNSGSTSPIIIDSPGRISVSGNARALTLVNSTAQLNSFGYVFNGDPTSSSYIRPIYVDKTVSGSSTLILNNTTLYAYAGGNLYFNKPYYLIDKATTLDTVTGSFSNNIVTSSPYLTASWYGTDQSSNAAVIFGYTLKNTVPTQISSSLALMNSVDYISSQITSIITGNSPGAMSFIGESNTKFVKLAGLASDAPEGISSSSFDNLGTRVFLIPLYIQMNSGKLGFDEKASGLELGIERDLFKNFKAGAFGGFTNANIGFYSLGNTNDSENQKYYNLGIYGTYHKSAYYITALANYFDIDSNFYGYTDNTKNISTYNSFSSKALVTKLEGGYRFNPTSNFRVTPVIGLEYDHYDIPSNTLTATSPSWNINVNSFSKNLFKGYVGVNLLENVKRNDITYFTYQNAKVIRGFNSTDITTNQTIQNIPLTATYGIGKTSYEADLGFGLKSNNSTITFDLGTEQNSYYREYSGWLKFNLQF